MYYGVLSASGNDELIKVLERVLKEYSVSLLTSNKSHIIKRFHYFFPSKNMLTVHLSIQEYDCLYFFENLSKFFPSLDFSLRLKEIYGYCRSHCQWRAGELFYEERHYSAKTYQEERDNFAAIGKS